jgi:hypothetical protein
MSKPKLEEVTVDTVREFQEVIDSSFIPREAKIKILSNEGLKGFGLINKTNDREKYLTGYDFVITINEPIYEQLEDAQREYIIKDLISQVIYNPETGKSSLAKHDISTSSLVLKQYDIDLYLSIKESITTLLEQKKIQSDLAKQK